MYSYILTKNVLCELNPFRGRKIYYVGRIHFENKCVVCALSFWRNEGVGEQIKSVQF